LEKGDGGSARGYCAERAELAGVIALLTRELQRLRAALHSAA
jgi:hypothetical protein